MPVNTHRARSMTCFALGLFAWVAVAQTPAPDTLLHLKNGSDVRGKLVEIKNGAYVITLPDGRTVLYPTSDVDTAERIAPLRQPSAGLGTARLAPGRRVYVKPVTNKDIHEVVGNLLRDWGRWAVVEKPEDADILVRLALSGSAGWGRASIVATVEDASTGTQIWKSRKQTGNRTIFHGYTSPYNRAAEGILDQMKKASTTWPMQ